MLLHSFLLYLHILSVIASIGPFFTLIPICKKLKYAQGPAQQAYLDSVRYAVRITMHAGHVLVVSGILLVFNTAWTWNTPWIVTVVVIMASSLFFLARAFTPIVRKFSDEKQDKELLSKKLLWTTLAYIFILIVMLWFMVAKPMLWW